ncbi:MAG: hypothetical protein ACMXX5_00455 [Candidatus Woesearchaeota archaeon]
MQKKRCIDSARSQISIFFILGMLFILLIALYIFSLSVLSPEISERHIKDLELEFNRQALENYVNYCIVNETSNILKQLGVNGGTLNQTETERHSRLYYGESYRKLCVNMEGSRYCINRILTLDDMENEIAEKILENLDNCIDFDYFKDRGYIITKGNKSMQVKITDRGLTFNLNYRINMAIESQEITAEQFYASIEHPLGMVYKLVMDIINSETAYGFFDKDEWMQDNNMLFSIQKKRPYPYILYSIHADQDFTFKFSIETEDQASRAGRNYLYDLEYGCCYIKQTCFKNADQYTCRKKGGVYEINSNCICRTSFAGSALPSISYKDCGERKNGESWCVNEQGIGGRSIVHSCHDGENFIEECKDFNEEICVESSQDGLAKASCKINRWHDCTRCDTTECCENDILRDCKWMPIEYQVIIESDSGQCVPKVPPGFRFWDGAGQEVCNIGTRYARCNGFSCDQSWVQYTADYCSSLGSCGINKNYNGILTTSGYLNTDPRHRASFTEKAIPFISTNRKQDTLIFSEERESIEMIPALITAWLNYLDDASRGREIILDYSFCGLWQQPLEDQMCNKCNENGICSEYKCYSLGQSCIYKEENGYPICEFKSDSGQEIEINFRAEYDYDEKTIDIAGKTLNGFEISNLIHPYELINFGITTNVETKCKITYMPQLRFTETPAIWFGKPEFAREHNVAFRLPEKITIPEKLYENLNITSIQELYEIIITEYNLLEDLFSTSFVEIIRKFNEFIENKDYLIELLRLSISGIDNNKYYVFLRCSDQSGQENQEPVFISFEIDEDFHDTEPAKLLSSYPANQSRLSALPYPLHIFLNKPAECKYSEFDTSYALMEHEFECETSRLRLSSIAGGSYECRTSSDIPELYIKCKDNPPELRNYAFKVIMGMNESDINYQVNETQIILTQHRLFNNTNVYMPRSDALYDVSMILPRYHNCKIGFNGYNYDLMNDLECEEINSSSRYYMHGSMNCSRQMVPGDYTAYIMCAGQVPQQRNINPESFHLQFFLDEDLSIISYFPEEYEIIDSDRAELGIVVNRDIAQYGVNCGYKLNTNELFQMYQYGTFQFKRNIDNLMSGTYDVEFSCIDNAGNTDIKQTTFIIP